MTSLILGTAQFGLPYGITNRFGKIQRDRVFRLLDDALKAGVKHLDTSPHYGEIESVLGKYSAINQFAVISKSSNDDLPYEAQVEKSLTRLGRDNLNFFLTHGADALTEEKADLRFTQLIGLKEKGLVKHIGASIYCKEQIDFILENFDVDLLQLPFSIFDQRLLEENYLQKLKARGVSVHVRSIFLQGLLLASNPPLPDYFEPLIAHLKKFSEFCKAHNLSRIQACCAFINSHQDFVDGALFGVTTANEFKEVAEAFKAEFPHLPWRDMAFFHPEKLDPRNWPVVNAN